MDVYHLSLRDRPPAHRSVAFSPHISLSHSLMLASRSPDCSSCCLLFCSLSGLRHCHRRIASPDSYVASSSIAVAARFGIGSDFFLNCFLCICGCKFDHIVSRFSFWELMSGVGLQISRATGTTFTSRTSVTSELVLPL